MGKEGDGSGSGSGTGDGSGSGTGDGSKKKVEVVVEKRVRRACPEFKGDLNADEYDVWKSKVKLWFKICGDEFEQPAGEILFGLCAKAYECVWMVDWESLGKQEGVDEILRRLDERYAKEKQRDRYDKLCEYFYIKRKDGESMREYANRYEVIERRCKIVGKVDLGEDMKCVHLLEGANVSENQRQMVLAYCGKDEWVFRTFRDALINICEGFGRKGENRENRSDVAESCEKSWYSSQRVSGPRSEEWVNGQLLNVKDKNGVVSECNICRSKFHYAYKCPSRGRGAYGDSRGRGNSSVVGVGRGRGRVVENVEHSATGGGNNVDDMIFYGERVRRNSEESVWRRKKCDLCRSDKHLWRDCDIYGDYSEVCGKKVGNSGVNKGKVESNVVSSNSSSVDRQVVDNLGGMGRGKSVYESSTDEFLDSMAAFLGRNSVMDSSSDSSVKDNEQRLCHTLFAVNDEGKKENKSVGESGEKVVVMSDEEKEVNVSCSEKKTVKEEVSGNRDRDVSRYEDVKVDRGSEVAVVDVEVKCSGSEVETKCAAVGVEKGGARAKVKKVKVEKKSKKGERSAKVKEWMRRRKGERYCAWMERIEEYLSSDESEGEVLEDGRSLLMRYGYYRDSDLSDPE